MTSLTPQVLFEDPHLIVLSKPAGLLSQGEKKGEPNLVDWLRERWGRPYVGLVHRLDRNTSGLMVVAKRTKSAQRLTRSLQSDRIRRTYLAWVEGAIPEPKRWVHRLHKDPEKNLVQVLRPGTPLYEKGKEAILRATPLATSIWNRRPVTLLEIELETGRSHQIRVQAAFEGHPLLGDRKYGGDSSFPRVALHSARLEFPHPMSGEIMHFETPLPEDLASIGRKQKRVD